MIEYRGQLKKYPFIIRKENVKQRGNKVIQRLYNDSIITFDIETTSAFLEDGNIIGYRKGMPAEYWNSLKPLALCYIWQCSVDGVVYYGRELETFIQLLDDLPVGVQTIIWVHNLAWEFAFLQNIMAFKHVFARTPHKPIYAVPEKYDNIEFKCSYTLTRLSLASWGKQIGLPKFVGDLDYDVIRTPRTKLTRTELGYCERDCLVVEAGIKDYLKRYKNQWDIPLTQTGTVRRPVKEMLTQNKEYMKKVKKTVPKSDTEYKRAQRCAAGGYVHTNRLYSGKKVEFSGRGNDVGEHYDYKSAYPFDMIAFKYPATPWVYRPMLKSIPDEKTFDDMAYIMTLKFKEMQTTTYNTFIQVSKCASESFESFITDNGRLIYADDIEITITEQDWLTIRDTYEWADMEVVRVWSSYKQYLPKEYIEFILQLYENKTTLKNVPEKADLYSQSKQYLNSLFGMALSSIIYSDVVYDPNTYDWHVEQLTRDMVNDKLNKLRNPFEWEKRYFLNYYVGVYVTAYARRNLARCIIKYDRQVMYCDTDSIFINGRADFSEYNAWAVDMLKKSAAANGFDFERTRPKDPDGIPQQLGEFAREPDVIAFKALGAKRYLERRTDGKLYLTVAGINKEAVACLNDDMDAFTKDFEFDKDHESVTKKLLTYIDDQPVLTWPDGYTSTARYGINLRRTGYKLTIPSEYEKIVELSQMTTMPEAIIIQQRGKWRA